jgi:hypothetical protein
MSDNNNTTRMEEKHFATKVWMPEYIRKIETMFHTRIYDDPKCLFCLCTSTEPPELTNCGTYPDWCLHLRCRAVTCRGKKKWYVCVLCINNHDPMKRMHSTRHTKRHNQIHLALAEQLLHGNGNIEDDSETDNFGNYGMEPEKVVEELTLSPSGGNNDTTIVNPHVHKHIEYYQALEKNEAMKFVVNSQFAMQTNITTTISPIDARLHTLIASVTFSQTKNENVEFAKLLQLIKQNNQNKIDELINEREYFR